MTPSDTPSVIHSGTRANALHIAAESGSAQMTTLILEAIQSPDLMAKMYPGESLESRVRRQEYLFDLYLNSHLKGGFDTPLHVASKYGFVDVVALLVQYSSCDTVAKNKHDQTPADIAGSRMRAADDTLAVEQIKKLLTNHVYIPVFRVDDFSHPAFVGEPWSPRPSVANQENGRQSAEVDLGALSPILIRHQLEEGGTKSAAAVRDANTSSPWLTPPSSKRVQKQPKSPYFVTKSPAAAGQLRPRVADVGEDSNTYSVQAIMGPLTPDEARKIQAEWRRPKCMEERLVRLSDPVKGIERQGRSLVKTCTTSANLIEYWEFLDTYCDLSTPLGMELLDEHLKSMSERCFEQKEQRPNQMDLEESFTMSRLASAFGGLQLAEDQAMNITSSLDNLNLGGNRNDNVGIHQAEQDQQLQEQEQKSVSSSYNETTAENPCLGQGSPPRKDLINNNLSPEAIWHRPRISVIATSPPIGMDSPERGLINEDDDEDGASSCSFHTVASSLPDSLMTAEEGEWVYIQGIAPTRVDHQVYQIIRDVDVPKHVYPYLAIWKDLMSTLPDDNFTNQQAEHGSHVGGTRNQGGSTLVPKKLFD